MKLPAPLTQVLNRFDAISPRERLLVTLALLGSLLALWDRTMLQPLTTKKNALAQELVSMQQSLDATTSAIESDPLNTALAEEARLKQTLQATNNQIAAASAGLLPPRKMIEVIHDVLKQHPGVVLVSLKNEPVQPLVPPAAGQPENAPYMHPIELVVEGSYLDVLAYLRTLESSPWRLHWHSFEIKALSYPRNRVRIELNTLSMEKEWLGV